MWLIKNGLSEATVYEMSPARRLASSVLMSELDGAGRFDWDRGEFIKST